MTLSVEWPESGRVARRFSAAATVYDHEALAQRQSALYLIQGGDFRGRVLDIGCGTGWMSARIAESPGVSGVVAMDIAAGMLQSPELRGDRICRLQADALNLPLATASFDGVVSNFALQWLSSPESFARELARVLRGGGDFHLAMPVEGTLRELREAWSRVEPSPPLNRFFPSGVWMEALAGSGLQLRQAEVKPLFQYYPSVRAMLRALKSLGAGESAARRSGMWGKGRLQALEVAMDSHRTAQGLPLRYEVLFLRGYRS